jgi:lysophospholipase L1-like esterase
MIEKKVRIFLAGDSTVAYKDKIIYPEAGWGQKLINFFNTDVKVFNHAMNGRSSKSFIAEDRLRPILEEIDKGDFLFIQFGHNDEKTDDRGTDASTTYKENLMQYIIGARNREAFPVLITPVSRRTFAEDGTVTNSHEAYYHAMVQLAKAENVPLIDLCMKSKALYETLGPEKSKELFVWIEPGMYKNFPDGKQDNTHFQHAGAEKIARLVAEEILAKNIKPLSTIIKFK